MIPVPPAIIRICLGELNGYWILTLNGICLNDTTGVEDGFNSDRKEDILPSGYFLINKSKVPLSAFVLIGVYGRITISSPSSTLTPARIHAHVLKPSPFSLSGRPNRSTKDVGETEVFSSSGTAVKESENWHSPVGTMDLTGREVRVEGKTHSLALEASEVEAQQFMFNTKGNAIGKMRLRKLRVCKAIIQIMCSEEEGGSDQRLFWKP